MNNYTLNNLRDGEPIVGQKPNGIDVTTGTKKITITDADTLVDVNQSINIVNMTSVTLEKATSAEENEFLQGNDFSNILKNYHIRNNVPNN